MQENKNIKIGNLVLCKRDNDLGIIIDIDKDYYDMIIYYDIEWIKDGTGRMYEMIGNAFQIYNKGKLLYNA